MDTDQNTVVVLGGTGKTGSRVAGRLRARGVPVRIGSRTGSPPFDWEDPSTWDRALRGARAAYVAYYPDLAMPGSPEAIAELAEQALAAGCRRLVLLSDRGAVEAERAERALQASGAEWTVLRCSWFMQNFSESYFAEPIAAGELALPAGDVRAPFVDAEDIADVATAALLDDRHAGRLYELTGPRALTHAEVVDEIGRAIGRPVRYVPVRLEAYRDALTAEGVPPDIVSLLSYLFAEVLVDDHASVADGVLRALGREPRDITAFARDAARAGAWARPMAA